jgi:transcriptional regulator with XRE-family HTH domain
MNNFQITGLEIRDLIDQLQNKSLPDGPIGAFHNAGFTESKANSIIQSYFNPKSIIDINLEKLLLLLDQNSLTPRMVSKSLEKRIPTKDPSEKLFATLAAQIIAKRQELGLSTEKLANLSNVSRSAILNIESGTNKMQFDTIMAVCNILGIDFSDLIMSEKDYVRMDSIGQSLQSQQFNKLKSDLQEIYQREELVDATNNYLSSQTSGKKSKINKKLRLMMQQQSNTNETVSNIGAAAVATAMVVAAINAPATSAVFGTLALMSVIKNKSK